MRFIRAIVKLIGIVILIVLVGVGIMGGRLFLDGYSIYKEVIEETPITQMVERIQEDVDYVTIDEISPYFEQAIVAIEDRRFHTHGGIDLIGLGRAMIVNFVSGDVVQGGSTITQQLAKNMYFTNEQTMIRKVAELFVAIDLEEHYAKDELLELYMNIIYFGRNSYGIEEASQQFFGKSASSLTREEAAYLAGMPQAPSIYSQNEALALQRQEVVLEAMSEQEF